MTDIESRSRTLEFFTSLLVICLIAYNYTQIVVSSHPDPIMPSPARLSEIDPTSYSEPEIIRTKHVQLDWRINFDKKTVSGLATYEFQVQDGQSVDKVLLDVDDITIANIVLQPSSEAVQYTITDPVRTIGSKLTIDLPRQYSGAFSLTIAYETSSTASALQWLTPAQTLGKQHPYMFSQCQPIQARSLLPCQDTPAVKFTYAATVRHPSELTALLSAVRLGSADGVTSYEQTVPIPSYLLAIAVGDVVSRSLGPISNVWAEAAIVDAAAAEFSETADMLRTASDICGEYVWKRYDLLVMPPSFPFGGMENPCLTFVTPTLLAGDKSLASVVAHEIAHSWTGNLVTNANFEHFWLNEGFTVFVEAKIVGRMKGGAAARDFHSIQGLSELRDTINGQLAGTPLLSKLVVDLTGPLSPEDAFSVVPYVKGQTFLRYIEDALGGAEVFEPFLRSYFEQFKYKSIVTEDFKQALLAYFAATKAAELQQIDWDEWLYGTGMPAVIPDYHQQLAQVTREHAKLWASGQLADILRSPLLAEADELSSNQRGELLSQLLEADEIVALGADWLAQLERAYSLDGTRNCNLLFRLARLAIKARLPERLPGVFEFANSNFRMKYVRPIYRDLAGWPEARTEAISNFRGVRDQMMAVCANQVAKDLGVK